MNRLDSWWSADGRVTKITDLKTDHLLNIVAKILRDPESVGMQQSKVISLKKEIVKRFAN